MISSNYSWSNDVKCKKSIYISLFYTGTFELPKKIDFWHLTARIILEAQRTLCKKWYYVQNFWHLTARIILEKLKGPCIKSDDTYRGSLYSSGLSEARTCLCHGSRKCIWVWSRTLQSNHLCNCIARTYCTFRFRCIPLIFFVSLCSFFHWTWERTA